MRRTKEELQKMNVELEWRLSDLRSDFYNIRKESDNLKEELEARDVVIKKLENQVHFLAWILYKEWVSLDNDSIHWLNVIVEQKITETTDNSYTSSFTYANK